jgi:hypothetical protein
MTHTNLDASTPAVPDSLDPLPSQMTALQDAAAQLRRMDDAWWRVNDDLRLLRGLGPEAATFIDGALADLDNLDRPVNRLRKKVLGQLERCRDRIDVHAVRAMTQSPEDEATLRARLAQADVNLGVLYKHLLQLGRQFAQPLVNEVLGNEPGFPPLALDAAVRIDLDYLCDQDHPPNDAKAGHVMAHQEALFCWVTKKQVCDNAMKEDLEKENWIDMSHPWMDRQCWLTHDVLEHNYGHNPHFGVAALLQTGTVRVQVKTTRSYEYDLHAGRFASPDAP